MKVEVAQLWGIIIVHSVPPNTHLPQFPLPPPPRVYGRIAINLVKRSKNGRADSCLDFALQRFTLMGITCSCSLLFFFKFPVSFWFCFAFCVIASFYIWLLSFLIPSSQIRNSKSNQYIIYKMPRDAVLPMPYVAGWGACTCVNLSYMLYSMEKGCSLQFVALGSTYKKKQ